ncbi:copper-binding protein [Cupriavidus sp. a3]|uniref:copper-binding protein n=1 Tax=Cupriavidus sp. a3 TaxID=3242158 RepID=UPI003D9C1608
MNHVKTFAAALALAAAPVAFAAGSMDSMDMKTPAATRQAPRAVAAEIKKIDARAGKVTLKHGPIENLGMQAMTMAVKDPASLKNFKEGESVSAIFDTIEGKPTVIDLRHK